MRVEFERDEKKRRKKLRKLLKKNEEMIEQLAKRPDVQRVRERRLFQQVQEGARIEEDEAHLVGCLNDKLRESQEIDHAYDSLATNQRRFRRKSEERQLAYDLKQEFKKQASEILRIEPLREQIVRAFSEEKEAAIKEQQRTKSVERERKRIRELRDVDAAAYEEALDQFEARKLEQQLSLLSSVQQRDGATRPGQAPSLFVRAATMIEEERRKHQETRLRSTFKPAQLQDEEEDAFLAYHASRTVKPKGNSRISRNCGLTTSLSSYTGSKAGASLSKVMSSSLGRNPRNAHFVTMQNDSPQDAFVLPELDRASRESSSCRSVSELYDSLSKFDFEARPRQHKRHIDNSVAGLTGTKFMQELNTLSIERRRKDFTDTKVSSAVISRSYKGCGRTLAEAKAAHQQKVKTQLMERVKIRIGRGRAVPSGALL